MRSRRACAGACAPRAFAVRDRLPRYADYGNTLARDAHAEQTPGAAVQAIRARARSMRNAAIFTTSLTATQASAYAQIQRAYFQPTAVTKTP